MTRLLDYFRGWNRLRIAAQRARRAPSLTPFGFYMNGLHAMQTGSFEPEETALVRSLLQRADRFANVGANTGYYCLFARQLGVKTIAIEPVAQNVAVLIKNLAANGWTNGVSVLPVAAGPAPGFAQIYGVGTGSSLLKGWADNPESLSQTVPVLCLDDIVAQPAQSEVLFVLMDVEGFEYPALQGASGLINCTPKPIWLIEIAPDGAGTAISSKTQATFDLMIAAGYAACEANKDLKPASGPVSGITNYLFFDAALGIEHFLGPKDARVQPYLP